MKAMRIFSVLFIICVFLSCQKIKENKIILTDFTKELISLYINDAENINAKNRKDEIIIISFTDSLHYYYSLFANNNKEFKFCREDFVGQTSHSGHLIRVFGDGSAFIFSVKEKSKSKKRCKETFTEYDPDIWRVCFHKDKSFCRMKTYKVTADGDIAAIQDLAEKYFKISDIQYDNDYIYQIGEVENAPEFSLGEDSLQRLISSNFNIRRDNEQNKIPVVVHIVIDKNGKAKLKGVVKSSNSADIDNEALRIAKIICQYDFIPASHRGDKVNSLFPLVIY